MIKVLNITINILLVPLSLLTGLSIIWYLLPTFGTTNIGVSINDFIGNMLIFSIVSSSLYIVLSLVQRIWLKSNNSKLQNFFIHLDTWLISLLMIGLAIYTFVCTNPLTVEEVVITMPKKIVIGLCFVGLLITHIFSGKLLTVINRRLQSYETAKELKVVGRGSIICTNLLKMFEILFPEILVLILLCMCVSWNVSAYFIILIVSCIIIVVGNIESDINTRKEAKELEDYKHRQLVNEIADKVKENSKGRKK